MSFIMMIWTTLMKILILILISSLRSTLMSTDQRGHDWMVQTPQRLGMAVNLL